MVAQIPPETLRQSGTFHWYGAAYTLDDLIVYAFYGHKREHSAQIAGFRDRLRKIEFKTPWSRPFGLLLVSLLTDWYS